MTDPLGKPAEWETILSSQIPQHSPELVVFGGGSATGKSTAISLLDAVGVTCKDSLLINAELIRSLHPELNEGALSRHPEKAEGLKNKYYAIRQRMVLDCLSKNISVVLDDHCDDLESLKQLMQKIRVDCRDVQTALVGLFMQPDAYVERLKKIGITAPSIDYDFAITSAQAFYLNFSDLTTLFDTSVLIENESKKPVVVAQYIAANGTAKEIKKDEKRYNNFAAIERFGQANIAAEITSPENHPGGMAEAGRKQHREGKEGLSLAQRLNPDNYEVDWKELARKTKRKDEVGK